jgi:hypothetical protein
MSSNNTARARRFTNESNGRKLVQAVQDFRSGKGWPSINARGFWESFASWAAARPDLRQWTATGAIWSSRYRRAAYRFSPAGEQHAMEAIRVADAARVAGVSTTGLWEAIGQPKDRASRQLHAEEPWCDGALERLADRLGVTVASLHGTVDPTQEPPPLDKAKRRDTPATVGDVLRDRMTPVSLAYKAQPEDDDWDGHGLATEPMVKQAVEGQGDLAAAVADTEELRRLRRVFRLLSKLAKIGGRLDNRDLREIVGYGRGRDMLDLIMAQRLAESRPIRMGSILDQLDGEDDGEGGR